jgi:L-fucose mutarotase
MLIGIPPVLSPELLSILSRMGHGDEIVLADAHFPGESVNPARCLRADGVDVAPLLEGILRVMALDAYAANAADSSVAMMAPMAGDSFDPAVKQRYTATLAQCCRVPPAISEVERFAFYDRARKSFAVVMTSDVAKYGNIILRKGVTPPYVAPSAPSQ